MLLSLYIRYIYKIYIRVKEHILSVVIHALYIFTHPLFVTASSLDVVYME